MTSMKRRISLILLLALVLALGLSLALVLAQRKSVTTAKEPKEPAVAAWTVKPVNSSVAPSGLAQAGDTIYIADSVHSSVQAFTDGKLIGLAGGETGYRDGSFDEALFAEPWAVITYENGLLVSDAENNALRYLDLEEKQVSTVAGAEDGLERPAGLAIDSDGTVYIANTGKHVILALDSTGTVTTYAGGSEGCALGTREEVRFSEPTGLCWSDGVLYVADTGNHRIIAISHDGTATLAAGAVLSGDGAESGGCLDGTIEEAEFASPQGITAADGVLYVADTANGSVRIVKDGQVTTLDAAESEETYPVSPRGLLASDGSLYAGDIFSMTLLQYTPQS